MHPKSSRRHPPTPPVERSCEQCGALFRVQQTYIRRGFGRTCSRACALLLRYGTTEERFWRKVDKGTGAGDCWVWIGWTGIGGYGEFTIPGTGKSERAHRTSYRLAYGPIPDGLDVLHRCDNPPCVRPDHLFLGTDLDNARDRESKGRGHQRRGEGNGRARLTEEQVKQIRSRYAGGGITQATLAAEYGVSAALIYYVLKGLNWRHVS